MKYEYCCKCGCATGKAGAGEDSLYTEEDGPFCEDCYPEKQAQQSTWVGLTDDEIVECWARPTMWATAHAIEAKLKEKNT
jgi:hypothetical protein